MTVKTKIDISHILSWKFIAIAFSVSTLVVWQVEQFVVSRELHKFQKTINRQASFLANGKEKAVVLGSLIMLGSIDPMIRASAQGALIPDDPKILEILARLNDSFGLSNIRIIDQNGIVVAYHADLGASGTGENRNTRPYFTASMQGKSSMYPALGHTAGERGFYISAPILAKDSNINVSSLGFKSTFKTDSPQSKVIGAIVAKLNFKEVDSILEQQEDSLAVVSPEGVVFATNVPAWQYKVLGNQKDLDIVMHEERVNEAFAKAPPQLWGVNEDGKLSMNGKLLTMSQSEIDWKDPHGSWKLVGFTDEAKYFSILQRILVGSACFIFMALLGAWWQARKQVAERNAELKIAYGHLEAKNQFIKKIFGRYMSDDVVEKILESPDGLNLGGKSLQVTVMFTDLRGFSAISESLHPESVVEMLNIYLHEMTRVIFKYSGTINEFMGDGILVLFGAPSERNDDADRALACALEMQLAMETVNLQNLAKGFPKLEMGIGIHTGMVVAGNIGSDIRTKYAVVGSNVNLTARVESFTVGGQILITQAAMDAVSDELKVAGQFSAPFKGIKEPVTMYDIVGINGTYNLALPEVAITYKTLQDPLQINFERLDEKTTTGSIQQGQLTALADKNGILVSPVELEIHSNIKWTLAQHDDSPCYAKIKLRRESGEYEINFTSVPKEILNIFQPLKT